MATETQVQDRLRRKYRQPEGVEQFGIEPIPDHLKTVKWYDLFFIVVNFLINPGMILIGGLAVAAGLSFWAAVTAEVCGILVAFGAYIVMATLGVDYGLPGQVATRMSFGLRGAKWVPSLLRTIASVYWFAFQTIAGAMAIVAVLDNWLGGEHSLILVAVIFGIVQVIVAIIGYNSLKHLSRIAFPVKVAIFIYLFVLLAGYDDPNFAPAAVFGYEGEVGWEWLVFVTWLNAVAAAWLTMITDAADFCRYSRTRGDMWVGTMAAALIGTLFSGFLGAYGAAATLGETANPFEVIADISTSGLTLALVFIVIVLDNWTINVLNLYTAGLSLSNMFEKLGRFWTTLMASVVGVALSAIPDVVNRFTEFMSALGNFFAPLAGILIFDYLFLKRTQIDVVGLFEREGPYWYLKGANPVALAWTVIGFLIYMFVIPTAWIQTLVTMLIVGIGYYVTVRLVAPHIPYIARAAKPGEQRESVDEVTSKL